MMARIGHNMARDSDYKLHWTMALNVICHEGSARLIKNIRKMEAMLRNVPHTIRAQTSDDTKKKLTFHVSTLLEMESEFIFVAQNAVSDVT